MYSFLPGPTWERALGEEDYAVPPIGRQGPRLPKKQIYKSFRAEAVLSTKIEKRS